MVTYHPDILPFNIAIARISELPIEGFTDAEGGIIEKNKGATWLGCAIKAIRHDREYGNIPYSLLLFPAKPKEETIAHEAFHAACDLLENINIHYRAYDANEIYAYVIGYITGCIHDAIKKDKVWELE